MKLREFKELRLGEAFLYADKVWTRTDYESASELFNHNACSFGIEPACLFVYPLNQEELKEYLNGKTESEFLDDEDRELNKLADILDSMVMLRGIHSEEWINRSSKRTEFISKFLKEIKSLDNISNEDFTEEANGLAITHLICFYLRQKEKNQNEA